MWCKISIKRKKETNTLDHLTKKRQNVSAVQVVYTFFVHKFSIGNEVNVGNFPLACVSESLC